MSQKPEPIGRCLVSNQLLLGLNFAVLLDMEMFVGLKDLNLVIGVFDTDSDKGQLEPISAAAAP